ncbi:hypothetical protein [Streptomyces sp. NPDC058092]|uniref:hypothetical protein n=1 Tax=Streptomyces sp. NPDC058092 TaxID=3346336 RepID=UPI0036EEDD81
MHIGPWNTTPCLILSTELMGQGGIVVNALQVRGESLLPLRTPDTPGNADIEIRDKAGIPYPNAIHIPASDGKRARTVDGFQVAEADRGWFGQLLARTGAANLTALAGGGPQTAQYLTTRQGRQHYDVPTFAATSSVDDADIQVGGTKFVGTDHVFRMGSVRIEAFSGMTEPLYELIKKGLSPFREPWFWITFRAQATEGHHNRDHERPWLMYSSRTCGSTGSKAL